MHITSLPGPFGIGEIGQHALQFVDTMKKMQLGVWQFLPTGPTAFADSPYQPLSTFAGNELLIDISDLISKGLLSEDEASELTTLPCNIVDYGALIPVKNRILRLASARFADKSDAALTVAYQEFVHENNDRWLHDYALFRVLKSQHGDRPRARFCQAGLGCVQWVWSYQIGQTNRALDPDPECSPSHVRPSR